VFAVDKAKAGLGWSPQTSLADGIKKTVDFFRTT
jgi:nucleoside-diphosphate-sugar epimerase